MCQMSSNLIHVDPCQSGTVIPNLHVTKLRWRKVCKIASDYLASQGQS